jgi:hypothetical protein
MAPRISEPDGAGHVLPDFDQSSIRSRAVWLLQWGFVLAAGAFILICADLYIATFEHWLVLIDRARTAAGFPPPAAGVDWVLILECGAAAALPLGLVLAGLAWHRRKWTANLRRVWPAGAPGGHVRIARLRESAGSEELTRRGEYLRDLLRSPTWASEPARGVEDADAYRVSAAELLARLEPEIRNRALVTGLSVGITHNRLLELFTIAASALELQLHVLGRLGKKPSPRVWAQMLRSTAGSLFINTYLNREDCYAVRLAITKAAIGLEIAGDALASVGDTLADIDLDGVIPDIAGVPLHRAAEMLGVAAGYPLTVGAEGLKRIGNVVEQSGVEILEGVLAGGILYYHGMALAADCLALDLQHRASPEMNRSIRQAVFGVCATAAGILRNYVRAVRRMLRSKRAQAFEAGAARIKQGGRSALGALGRKFHSKSGDDIAPTGAA